MARSIRSYTNTLSYRPGEDLSLHCDGDPQEVAVSLKRLTHSSDRAKDITIPWSAAGTYHLGEQRTCLGSFATGSIGTVNLSQFMVGCFFWLASDSLNGTRTIWSIEDTMGGVCLLRSEINGDTLRVTSGEDSLEIEATIRPYVWYYVATSITDGQITVELISTDPLRGESGRAWGTVTIPEAHDASLTATVAGRDPRDVVESGDLIRGHAEATFTGKIEGFSVVGAAVSRETMVSLAAGEPLTEPLPLIASWDFAPYSAGDDPNRIRDRVSGSSITLVNLPTQAVTGRFFDGTETDYRIRPDHYAAVHFHNTDMSDAGWEPLLTARLPEDLRSGVYAIEVVGAESRDEMPVFVVPPLDVPTKRKVAVVLPTFCYLAYANEELYANADPSAMTSVPVKIGEEDLKRIGDFSYGLSMYDHHSDGSGVAYSSSRRAIVNMRRGYQVWLYEAGRGFSADMYLVEWLEYQGIEYDILTDLEVHNQGASALQPYSAVISGMHPEYTSGEMLDAYEHYRDEGGGLMYLGGNGWYWVTGVYSGTGLAVEIRRGHAGILTWTSYAGETVLISGKQHGGLWKYRGRPPQRIFGVGMAAQGWGKSYPYYRNEAAVAHPDYAWIMEGIEEDPIGAYGEIMGGAAGDEIDRADRELGTPYHAVVIASSRGHDNYYQRVPEEVGLTLPSPNSPGGEDDPEVHSDIVYFRTPKGGEVFSAGSMAWSGALLHNGYVNGVSKMTENVLHRLLANRP